MLKHLIYVTLLVPTLSWAQTAPTEKLTLEEILRRNRIACGDSVTKNANYVVFHGTEYNLLGADTQITRIFKFANGRGGYHYREYRDSKNPKEWMIAGFLPDSAWFWLGRSGEGPTTVNREAAIEYFTIDSKFGTFLSEENVNSFQKIEFLGDFRFKGVDCFIIEYKKNDDLNVVLINRETFLINFCTVKVYNGDPSQPERLLIKFSDFRLSGYGMISFKQEYFREKETPYMMVIQTDYSISDTIDYSLFEKPVVSK
jgi:hypothetical protein